MSKKKEIKVRVPPKEAISKLEDLLEVEIGTLDRFLKKASDIRDRISKLNNIPQEYKDNVLSMYDQVVVNKLAYDILKAIVDYVYLISFAKELLDKKVLYAVEDSYGELRITYIPYLVKREERNE